MGDVVSSPAAARTPFRDVLSRVERRVVVDDSATYSTVGVRWYGKGAFVRETLSGASIMRKGQWQIRSGDVVYNKLFAWKGAFAVANFAVDGHLVSDKFPTYELDHTRVVPGYFAYWCQTEELARQAYILSKGAAAISKLTLNPPQFWDLTLPLPPISAQESIVSWLDGINRATERAMLLEVQGSQEREALGTAALRAILARGNYSEFELGALVDVRGGGTPTKANPEYWVGSIPWVSPKDMKSDEISDSLDHISDDALHHSAAKLIEPGSCLIVTRGMILARIVPVALLKVPAAINQDMKALRPKAGLSVDYLFWALKAKAPELLRLIERSTHDTRRLETPTLLGLRIPLPPIDEQSGVVVECRNTISRLQQIESVAGSRRLELAAIGPGAARSAFGHVG